MEVPLSNNVLNRHSVRAQEDEVNSEKVTWTSMRGQPHQIPEVTHDRSYQVSSCVVYIEGSARCEKLAVKVM